MSDRTIGEMSERRRPLLGIIREFGPPDLRYLAVAVALKSVTVLFGIADVFLIGLGIDALFNGRPLAIPPIPDAWIPSAPIPLLVFVAGLIFGLNLFNNLGGLVSDLCYGIFTHRLLHRLRVRTFAGAGRLDAAFLDESRTGNLMSVLNDDVNQLNGFLNTIIGAAVWIAVTLAGAFLYMSLLNVQLALFVLLSGPLLALVNYRFSRRLEPLQDAVRTRRGALNARLETNLGGLDAIKSFTAEGYERERVEAASLDTYRARFAAQRLAVRQTPVNRLIVGTWLLLTLGIGIYWILVRPPLFFSGTLTAGELVPFLFYMERITLPLKNLVGVIDYYEASKASAGRIDGLTRAEGRLERESGDELVVDGAEVTYEDVAFTYPGSDRRLFDGIDFEAGSGRTVGLVGSTGAGKSTLMELLLGFYEVDDGSISIDGRDVRDVSLADLRGTIGYVNQDPYLFDGSIQENVAYGDPTASDERIERAAREAGAHEFIADLPDGYETGVGEQGAKLSGGQRQRIAIARAVLEDPPILVLDEATSHVDNETELVIQERLAELTADRTTFVVAHRLSTVRNADRILVLDDGEVVERGTHDELVERGGTYATLWNVQIGDIDALPPS